jgi:Uncharacterized proteins, homologs of microcin C7 resistance protein MccF
MFDHVAGIVFGRCSDCDIKGPSLSLEEILRDRFASLPVPVVSGLSFGHIEQKLVLLIGARATLDADAGTLRIEEGRLGRDLLSAFTETPLLNRRRGAPRSSDTSPHHAGSTEGVVESADVEH